MTRTWHDPLIPAPADCVLRLVLERRAAETPGKVFAVFADGTTWTYRQTLEMCYACHKACEKPYLRAQVPSASSVSILNFDPNATWPE